MAATPDTLAPGDIIEIVYRVWRPRDGADEHVVEKWIGARVIDCEHGAWPLVRLSDGQVTEVRPFMSWRHLQTAQPRAATDPIAA